MKPDKPPVRKYGFICLAGRVGWADKIILPGLSTVGDGLFHLWTSGHTRLSASGSKGQRKRKII
ncbi:hypothetical protein AAA215_21470 [Phocaeicola vulgatus]